MRTKLRSIITRKRLAVLPAKIRLRTSRFMLPLAASGASMLFSSAREKTK